MSEKIHETFLQVSDLHIGDFAPDGSAITQAHWAKLRLFEGFLGHHHRALRRLDQFYRHLRDTEDAKLVVTGDLTASGSLSQFRDAALFLGARLPLQKGGCGLEAPNWATAGIPGNHDHWPGTNGVQGPPTEGLSMTFPQMPFVKTLPQLKTGHTVTFIIINTDADVTPHSLNRIFAQGSFISELEKLDHILQPPLPNEVRVLLLHHSRSYGPSTVTRLRLAIARNSWDALNQFIIAHNIRVLMSGHIHVQLVSPDSLRRADRTSVTFLESRCGTTTVRTTIPYAWRGPLGGFPQWQLPPNTAIVHRIVEVNGSVEWRAEEHLLGPSGFTPVRTHTLAL